MALGPIENEIRFQLDSILKENKVKT